MSLHFAEPAFDPSLESVTLFVSASIPNPERWDGPFDSLEITDAVVSLARVFLTAGARIVTAAHPTIAPLLLYVAAELPEDHPRRILTYQSGLFEDVLPRETERFRSEGIGEFVWTDAAAGERPEPGAWDASLEIMRRQMLAESAPSAAAFIGGMDGIDDEFALFTELRPGAPTYPLGRPGGAARGLAERTESSLRSELLESSVYPSVWRRVLANLRADLGI